MKLGKNRYEFVKEFPLSKLAEFKNHKRLKVFFHKGLQCSVPGCNRVGTRLILGRDNGGGLHVDIYTDDLVLMNVDHRIPKCAGGTWDLENLFPMCQPHNTQKGSKFLDENLMLTKSQHYLQNGNNKETKKNNRYIRRWRKFVRKFGEFTPFNDSLLFIKKIEIKQLHKVSF